MIGDTLEETLDNILRRYRNRTEDGVWVDEMPSQDARCPRCGSDRLQLNGPAIRGNWILRCSARKRDGVIRTTEDGCGWSAKIHKDKLRTVTRYHREYRTTETQLDFEEVVEVATDE